MAAVYVERGAFDAHIAEDHTNFRHVSDRLERMSTEAIEGRSRMHQRIDPINAKISAVESEVKMVNQNVCQLSAAVNQVIHDRQRRS